MEITVYIEAFDGKIVKAGLEALSAANTLAEKSGGNVKAVLLGNNLDDAIAKLNNYGVAIIFVGDGELFSTYHAGIYTRALANVSANAYVLPATVWGKEMGAALAAKKDYAYIGDISVIKDKNSFVRSIHGNKVLSTVTTEEDFVVTIRPGTQDLPAENPVTATVEKISVVKNDSDAKLNLSEILAAASGKIELTEADIIVSGGRGVGGPENFHLIEELADLLGAAVGASRAVVDAGWRPHSDQVGQTGKFVSPKMYIAVGISGAIQHLAGMSTSDIIVAINKDPEAPIFKVADYGVVADLFDAVPKLKDAIVAAKAE